MELRIKIKKKLNLIIKHFLYIIIYTYYINIRVFFLHFFGEEFNIIPFFAVLSCP